MASWHPHQSITSAYAEYRTLIWDHSENTVVHSIALVPLVAFSVIVSVFPPAESIPSIISKPFSPGTDLPTRLGEDLNVALPSELMRPGTCGDSKPIASPLSGAVVTTATMISLRISVEIVSAARCMLKSSMNCLKNNVHTTENVPRKNAQDCPSARHSIPQWITRSRVSGSSSNCLPHQSANERAGIVGELISRVIARCRLADGWPLFTPILLRCLNNPCDKPCSNWQARKEGTGLFTNIWRGSRAQLEPAEWALWHAGNV